MAASRLKAELLNVLQGLSWLRYTSEPAALWDQCMPIIPRSVSNAVPVPSMIPLVSGISRVALYGAQRNHSAALAACRCFRWLKDAWVQSCNLELEFRSSLHQDITRLQNLSLKLAAPALPGGGQDWKNIRMLYQQNMRHIQMAMWRKVDGMLTLLDEHADVSENKNLEEIMERVFRDYRDARDQIWTFLENVGNRCLPNIFRMDCGVDHLQVFRSFPPIHGPAMQGQVVDFLGVTTTWRAACGDLDQGEPHLFLAPGRSLDCLYAISGRPLRNWPLLDEEYLEWADVLHAASSAATRPGTGLRMAEIGAGRIGIWGIRAAKAFLRLKQDMGTHTSCDILLVEPFDLGSGLDLKNHILRNLPEGRCRITVKTDPARTAEDLKSLLSGEEPWDLVDIDAQGAEHGLLQGLTSWLAQRVRRLHVSTHTRRIHANIRHWLAEGGWTILAENGFYSAAQQHLGRFVAVDGHISATPSQYHGQNKHG